MGIAGLFQQLVLAEGGQQVPRRRGVGDAHDAKQVPRGYQIVEGAQFILQGFQSRNKMLVAFALARRGEQAAKEFGSIAQFLGGFAQFVPGFIIASIKRRAAPLHLAAQACQHFCRVLRGRRIARGLPGSILMPAPKRQPLRNIQQQMPDPS